MVPLLPETRYCRGMGHDNMFFLDTRLRRKQKYVILLRQQSFFGRNTATYYIQDHKMTAITDKRERKMCKKNKCAQCELFSTFLMLFSICSPTTRSKVKTFAYKLEIYLVIINNTKTFALIGFHHSKVQLHWSLLKLTELSRCLISPLIFTLA